MRKLILLLAALSLAIQTANAQPEMLRSPEVMERISEEVVQNSRQAQEALYRASGSAETERDQEEEEDEGWIRKHPILAGALIGLGVGFGIGLAVGHDDFTTAGRFVYYGTPGAAVGALIGLGVKY